MSATTSDRRADVAVVGVGAAGAATLYQLAARGVDVVGVDQLSPPHDRGSSHGDTRITRLAVGEGVVYTPLVRRSHEIWRELEAETGAELLVTSGCLVLQDAAHDAMHGSDDFLATTVLGAQRHGVEHERLTARDINKRFPQFHAGADVSACFEPSGGFVRPEACIDAQLRMAERHGARVVRHTRAHHVVPEAHGVRIRTSAGDVSADACVIAAGAWTGSLVPALRPLLRVHPQTLMWFEVQRHCERHTLTTMPAFIWVMRGGRVLYGIPGDAAGATVKVGTEQYVDTTDPDATTPGVDDDSPRHLHHELVASHLPDVSDRCARTARCLYTTTPDSGFIVDRDPRSERIVVVSACSGHGFKHSAALGEAVAELVTRGRSSLDLSAFRLRRFG